MNLLKKIMCGAGLAVVMMMCSCANGEEMSDNISESAAEAYTRETEIAENALSEAADNGNEDISYVGVTHKIESYYSRYISLNIEENEIAREEIEAAQAPSEGGTFVIFRAADNEPVRYRENLYGAMKQFEENYYIIGENEVYFTRLEKYYDTYHLEKADILNYVFTEYWIEGGEVYYLDRLNGKLVICGEDPVPKQFHEMAEADMIK
ncbi:MAG: hypothetical protein K2N72_10350 [Oscillospiraceae bacterium]|nr:hypothetical protein [Oscillospiraceae bacterium]